MLEVDGAYHDDIWQSMDDKRRARRLTSPGRMVVSCSAFELRHDTEEVIFDLIALGVPRV